MTPWRYLGTSLTGRISLAFIAPATLAIVCLSLVDNLSARESLKIADDKTLSILTRAISSNVDYQDGRIVLNIPPRILDNLQGERVNKTFYAVEVRGRIVLGVDGLHLHEPNAFIEAVRPGPARRYDYFDGKLNGEEVRVARTTIRLAQLKDDVVVYVASEPSSRRGAQRAMAGTFIVNGVAFLLCLIVIIAFSVRWAIKPLSGLKNEIEARPVDEDQPIPLDNVPIELRSMVTAFNDLIHRLQTLLTTTRRFTADASHQLRTPLSILRTHLDVIRCEGIDGTKGQSSLDDVDTAVNRLQRLLTQLLALARAEDAKPGRHSELFDRVDLVAIAKDAAKEHVADALGAGVEVQFEADPPSISVMTVDMLAREMMTNLLDNAIRYNARGGSVWLTVTQSKSGAHVVIEDDGPGIPSDETGRMCERFARLPRDRNHQGSGLGLAIVLALAKAIGVTVTLSPRAEGSGLRAEIFFPAA